MHHGLPRDLLSFTANPNGDYLAFLGRISPEKRPDRAIEIASRAGLDLKIAAKIDAADQAYWDEVIAPLVAAHPNVEFVGEIDEDQKGNFLGNARALLFPVDWPEPFGLVMIEAMACGTPVIAFRTGSVPEVIEEGATGFIVNDVDQAVTAVRAIDRIERAEVHANFEERFTAERMAADYLAIYCSLPGVRRAALHKAPAAKEDGDVQAVADTPLSQDGGAGEAVTGTRSSRDAPKSTNGCGSKVMLSDDCDLCHPSGGGSV